MKTLLLSLLLAIGTVSLYAGDAKSCQDQSSCCSMAKGSEQTKSCPASGKTTRKALAKKPLKSPKAAAELAQK